MRDRGLFREVDTLALLDKEEHLRCEIVNKLWSTVFVKFEEFQSEHGEACKTVDRLESFIKCYARILWEFKYTRNTGDKALNYAVSCRVKIYDTILLLLKEFQPVYEARFDDPMNFYDRLTKLSYLCGLTNQQMQFAIEGRLNHAEYHIEQTLRLKRGGLKRNEATNKARDFVVTEWNAHRKQYANNKSEFARTYVRLVASKFVEKNGDPLKVTEKTIREVWLANSPSAGT